jgi:Spx/MgsR family transcriptional regulator
MQALILYGIPNCSTVKKARVWLENSGVAYNFYDFKKQGVSQPLLENWLKQIPHEKLINRAGLTWRGLDDNIKTGLIDNVTAIALMQVKTSVIKRPILEKDGKIVALGFSEADYKAIFK